MRYVYNTENVNILREEKEGNTIIIASKTGIQLVLNRTGTEVLKALSLYTNVEQLIEAIHKNYIELDKRILERDINQILHLMEIYEIVKLEDETEIKQTFRVSIAGDIDYKKVSHFIKSCLNIDCVKYCNVKDEEYFSALQLRLRTMQNKEFGTFVEIDGEIKGFFSFSGDGFLNSNVLLITNLFFNEKVENEKEILLIMIDHVIRKCISQKSVKKVRIPVISEEESFMDRVLKMGFTEECVLKDEVKDGDVIFCTYWL